MFTLGNVIALSLVLFCIGAYGVLARRNLIVVLISVEIMLNAANLSLVAFSRHFAAGGEALALGGVGSADAGQIFVLMSMAVAAAEVAVGLALLIAVFRARGSIMTTDAAELKG